MSETDSILTVIDFYEGAYGPTIRIDIQQREWLDVFEDSIIKLESEEIPEFDVLSLSGVRKNEIGGLKLKLGSSAEIIEASSLNTQEKYPGFDWIVDAETIGFLIDAIDSLRSIDRAGHYYFHEDDEILIELSYKE